MLDVPTLMEVLNNRNFKTQTHRLYNELKYNKLADARQDLLHYFTAVRCRKYSLDEFKAMWNNTEPYDKTDPNALRNKHYLEYLMTYSRMNIIQNYAKNKKTDDDLIERLKVGINDTDTFDKTSKEELVLSNLNQLFDKSPKKREYITAIFNHDDYETAPTVSDQIMLKSITKYCDKHRNAFDELFDRDKREQQRKIDNFVTTFVCIERNNNITLFAKQGQQAQLINENRELFEDLLGEVSGVSHQTALLNNWERIEYQDDKCKVIDYMEGLYGKMERMY